MEVILTIGLPVGWEIREDITRCPTRWTLLAHGVKVAHGKDLHYGGEVRVVATDPKAVERINRALSSHRRAVDLERAADAARYDRECAQREAEREAAANAAATKEASDG